MAIYEDPKKKKRGLVEELGRASAVVAGKVKDHEARKAQAWVDAGRATVGAVEDFSRGYGDVASPVQLPPQKPYAGLGSQYGFNAQAPGYGVVKPGAAPSVVDPSRDQPAQVDAQPDPNARPVTDDPIAPGSLNTFTGSDGVTRNVAAGGTSDMAHMQLSGSNMQRPQQAQPGQLMPQQPQPERNPRPQRDSSRLTADEMERRAGVAFWNAQNAAKDGSLKRSQRAALSQAYLAEANYWGGGGINKQGNELDQQSYQAGQQRNLEREKMGSGERTAQMGLDAAQQNRASYGQQGGMGRPIDIGGGVLGYVNQSGQIEQYTDAEGNPVGGTKPLEAIKAKLQADTDMLIKDEAFMPELSGAARMVEARKQAMEGNSHLPIARNDAGQAKVMIGGEWKDI